MRYIVKMTGKAEGKGVLITDSYFEAMKAISKAFRDGLTITAYKEEGDGLQAGEDN